MLEYKSFLIKIKPLFYSIKYRETFQIARSLVLPQPSTLLGALAYTYAVINNIGRGEALKTISANVIVARAKLLSPAVIEPVVLRRLRILDKGIEKGDYRKFLESLNKGDILGSFKILTNLLDAMYREYIHTHEILALYILKSPISIKPELIVKLGDTESLCTIKEVHEVNAKLLKKRKVSTAYPFPLTKDVKEVKGSYITTKMCDEKSMNWETGKCELTDFIIPARLEFKKSRKGYRIPVYEPSLVTVEFSEEKPVFEVEGEHVIIGYKILRGEKHE